MAERSEQEEQLEAFKESYKEGLEGLLELLEVAPEQPLPPDPSSMGIDERTLEELSPEELAAARSILFERFGVDPEKLEEARVRQYSTPAPEEGKVPGDIRVDVYKTNMEEEGIVLQELTFADGAQRWVVGPDQDI